MMTAQYLLGAVLLDKIYNDYDSFAYFYNKYWTVNVPYYLKYALDELGLSNIDKGAEILDICCGTGQVAGILEEEGYKVTGVDGSQAVLDYAKTNAPESTFIQMDVRNMNLNKEFQVVTCLFDSINHLLEAEEVYTVFKNVYNHLQAGGCFIFDVNSQQSSEDADLSDFSAVEEDSVFISKGSYNKKTQMITFNVTYFIKENNSWQRNDTVIYERYYSERKLKDMLKQAGFKKIYNCHGEDLGIEAFEDRLFWRAYK